MLKLSKSKKVIFSMLTGVILLGQSSIGLASPNHFYFSEKEPNDSIGQLKYEDPFTVSRVNKKSSFAYGNITGTVDANDTIDYIKFSSDFEGVGTIYVYAPDGQGIFATLYSENGKRLASSSAYNGEKALIDNFLHRDGKIFYLELEFIDDDNPSAENREYEVQWYVDKDEL